MTTWGALYNVLVSHAAVDTFNCNMREVVNLQDVVDWHPALLSIATQFVEGVKPLTSKQVSYARSLYMKAHERN